jgi:hypothetical protein|tara:strand:- start:1886 stop:3706 length:1821 start_codon:yes stop_codon:yes gene_type:complete
MKNRIVVFIFGFFSITSCSLQNNNVQPFSLGPRIAESKSYSLSANGIPIPIGVEISNDSIFEISKFALKDEAYIEIEALGKIESYSIHPLDKHIQAEVKNNVLSFKMSEPLKLMVKVNNQTPLLIMAIPEEQNKPNQSDLNVLYFGPGEHHIGRTTLKSNQTVYISDGAVVYGTLEGYEVENVTIKGGGCLDGGEHTSWNDRVFGIYFERSKNITIKGISIRNCKWWVTEFLLCANVTISHIDIFSFYRNNGGLMMDGCTGFTASDCMIFTMDDCICPHALNAAGNGEPQANDYTFKNMVLYNVDAGNGIRIGASFETSKVQNWIFQDIYVLAHRGAALYADHSDWAEINNLQVINFYDEQSTENTIEFFIDKTRYSCFTGYRDERGHMKNILFKNVQTPGGNIVLKGFDANHKIDSVYFVNCHIGGKKINNHKDIITNEHVTNIQFIEEGAFKLELEELEQVAEKITSSPQQIVIDNKDPKCMNVGFEFKSDGFDCFNNDYLEATIPKGFSNFKAVVYEPLIKGKYDIYIYWGNWKHKATNARWIVHHTEGYTSKYFNLNNSPGWNYHGSYNLDTSSYIRLPLPGYYQIADANVIADAVKLVKVK